MSKRNARARQRAAERGADTYNAEVVDYWPTCVTCDASIRHRGVINDRTCDCPGVTWLCLTDGWQRRVDK